MAKDSSQLIELMPQAYEYNVTLNNLGQWWKRVTLVGKINSLGIAATLLEDMDCTRAKLEKLQSSLISSLVEENMRKLDQELSAGSQVAIDILIRNLFERTADVGFLATDDDIRRFLLDPSPEGVQEAIVERLHEYTLKYSVYDEIILLNADGTVMAHLDAENPISHSNDRLICATINSNDPFVETFRHSDLQPLRRHSLIYSARITETDDPGSRLLGVLCLCFRFDDEMAGIFDNLSKTDEIIAILDKQGETIASNDHEQLPLGSRFKEVVDQTTSVIAHENNRYLAKTARTNGYQGFYGLAWQGHIMKPAASAFAANGTDSSSKYATLVKDASFFSDELKRINTTANTIIDDLILVVLNGQIISAKRDAKEFMPVLDEIRDIGQKTKAVFDDSINNLYNTVVSSLLSDLQFQAALAVDIMDRNLYERANDVRWWALTTRFRELMAKPRLESEDTATLTSILAYINNLYTVYTNLFIYDTEGSIVAVSNPQESQLVGTRLAMDSHFKAALSIHESQKYEVSPFETTHLYSDRPTYIYLTAVRDLTIDRAVAGIGIVFDSEPEFKAMLNDALPRNDLGEVLEGAFGVFCDGEQHVVSSTNKAYPPGSKIKVNEQFLGLKNGQRSSAIITFEDRAYAVGAAMSQGYREYKTTGDYKNDVLGLIFVPV